MPPQTARTSAHPTQLDTVLRHISTAAGVLDVLANNVATPFLDVLCATTRALVLSAQNVRRNKNECTDLLESTNQLLQAILVLLVKQDSKLLSSSAVEHLGRLVETLHKVHHFLEAQQDRSRFRQFFKQSETTGILKECHAGLQTALDFFLLERYEILNDIRDLQLTADNDHQEILQMIQSIQPGNNEMSDSESTFSITKDSLNR
ncbi:hypothetical protein MIND_00189000 [Mycena indigotica]|uniref:Uncharacterized protein n=1 Tax=Mycena indigotica TaxID=2126181 RepID=A0A8H6T9F3_9AGAR|nr:uncharacterized protein MIND_00189000 [Mycena indigotica]KAF7311785.1 hypothetical protein MIND_00189000 [Mycena indigotica]